MYVCMYVSMYVCMYVCTYDFCSQSPHPFTFPLALAPLLLLPPPSPYSLLHPPPPSPYSLLLPTPSFSLLLPSPCSLLLPTPSFFPFPQIIRSLDSSPHSLLTGMKKKHII